MLIYGVNPVFEALHSAARPTRIYLRQGKDNSRIRGIVSVAGKMDVPVAEIGNLDKLAGTRDHQGVAAEIPALGEDELPQSVLDEAQHIVVFDSLRDPHNFGAALRVCEVFGFPQVVYCKGNSSGVTAAAVKVSAGAIFHVHIYQSNLNRAMQRLHSSGFAILALEADGDATIYDVPLPERYAVVIGSEGEGIRHNIRRAADSLVGIPQCGRVNSLNVSCALSAALSEFARRRDRSEG